MPWRHTVEWRYSSLHPYLVSRWRWLVIFRPQPFYCLQKESQYSLYRPCGPRTPSKYHGYAVQKWFVCNAKLGDLNVFLCGNYVKCYWKCCVHRFLWKSYIYYVLEKYLRFISVFWESESFFVDPSVLKIRYSCHTLWFSEHLMSG